MTNTRIDKLGRRILVKKNIGFSDIEGKQKSNLVIILNKQGNRITTRSFDMVKTSKDVDFDDIEDILENLDDIELCEVKATRRNIPSDFSKYFGSLASSEEKAGKQLGEKYIVVLVNTNTEEHLELTFPNFLKSITLTKPIRHFNVKKLSN